MLDTTARNLFFTGKGGVGKTTMSCSTAIRLADEGKRVLLVSTDPASNLDEVLGCKLETIPTSIEAVPGLWAMNIDPEQSAREYRERMVAPYRGLLPDVAIQSIEEQFSGACTVEIAAFDEFARLLSDAELREQFDAIVFDTAPTGHTLRLLSLPNAWSDFIQSNTSGASCVGTLAGMKQQQSVYLKTLESLGDPSQTTVVLVTRLELPALREAERTRSELNQLGIQNMQLVINGVFHASAVEDPYAIALEQRGEAARNLMPPQLSQLKQTEVALNGGLLLGIEALRNVLDSPTTETAAHESCLSNAKSLTEQLTEPERFLDELATSGRGVVMTMGKGGVGKTTIAAAVAVSLAKRGCPVRLTTTDPASHVLSAIGEESLDGLQVDRIDPKKVTEVYRAEVLGTAGKDLDAAGLALLTEELSSPCTEEIAVFRAFAEAVAQGKDGFVVLDTAPTGHTILLLDAALAYHREVQKQSGDIPDSVEHLLPRLRDKDFTKVLVVTLPESTPVHEAVQLQTDLNRAGIQPSHWIINQSLLRLPVKDPLLQKRKGLEEKYIAEVLEQSAQVTLIDWKLEAPVGIEGLATILSDQA